MWYVQKNTPFIRLTLEFVLIIETTMDTLTETQSGKNEEYLNSVDM